ncbi:pleckstrin homology domain-containing family G member 5-like isoform X2 [Gigantopelta aegis]|uniref:pleckstrin homology domain-containing family G member 5-like isoform X2 n=1 Tax=Gigantopelta aegis TaxID=1735272 RepID=UPI001B88CCF6|nr:pleckstrin homology domain-containing family G member 5-like isoform X2 [Gigantopelta aegis]
MKLKKKRFPRSFSKKKKQKDVEETEPDISAIISPITPATFFDHPFPRDAENADSAMSTSPLSSTSPVCMSPTCISPVCVSPSCASPSTDDGIDGDISELFTELIKEVEFNDARERELNFDRFTLDTISSCSVSSSPDLELQELENDIFLNLSEKQGKEAEENGCEIAAAKDGVPDLEKSEAVKHSLNSVCTCSKVCFKMVEVKHVEIKPQSDGNPETCLVISTCKAMICHHPECSENNGDRPLLLCKQCDISIHSNSDSSGHLVLDAPKKRKPVIQQQHSSSETKVQSLSEVDTEDEDTVDGFYVKKSESQKRARIPGPHETRLKRKKAYKKKSLSKNDSFLNQSSNLGVVMANSTGDANECAKDENIIVNGDPGLPPAGNRVLRSGSKSLSDCFTLKFESNNNAMQDIEIVTAIQGINLREILIPMLERRGLDIITVDAFVEQSKTPLPLNCDTFRLAGSTVHIRVGNPKKDVPDTVITRTSTSSKPSNASKTNSSKNNKSGGSLSRRRGNNLSIDDSFTVPSTSPHGTLTFREDRKSKEKAQNKLSQLFTPLSKDREKIDQLNEILSGYSLNGLPSCPPLLALDRIPFDEKVFQLEPHWSCIVDNASSLTKRQHDQQEAIWELLQTEISYISQLRVITDVFQVSLLNLQASQLLNEIETEKLFCNIDAICDVNRQFWEHYLLRVLNEARHSRKPLNPSLLKQGFTKEFSTLFQPYLKYCMEQRPCVEYVKSRCNENDLFKIFVTWAEAQKQCNRLSLTALLVQPMQRLTKYSLLIQAILRKTEDDRHRKDLLEMIASVDKFVMSINNKMNDKLNQERLVAVVGKIEPYDAVEPPSEECSKYISDYNQNFDLLSPMPGFSDSKSRALLYHSALRMKESQASRMDVDCFLFTDLLLLCKSNKRMDKYKITKPPMRLDRIIIHELKDKGSFLLIYLNEYHVPTASFTFHGDPMAVRMWLEQLKNAQEAYEKEKSKRVNQAPTVQEEVLYTSLHGYPMSTSISMLTRTESIESTEGKFIPNLATHSMSVPNQNGHCTTSHRDGQDIVRSGSLSNIVGHATMVQQQRQLSQSERGTLSSPEHSPSPGKRNRPVTVSLSTPVMSDTFELFATDIQIQSDVEIRTEAPPPSPPPVVSCVTDESVVDEETKLKLNQRRTSRTEKRYYTVDSVQELHKQRDKDNSIHKRLSWNLGTKLEEQRLKDKTKSCDSIRSIPSSSGFSSSGSLQNPESEICEEMESGGTNHDIHDLSSYSLGPDDGMMHLTHESKRNCKSTSDIVTLLQELKTSDVEEGISSVDLPTFQMDKRKLSHAQILKMKKQLLLNSNVEASEV